MRRRIAYSEQELAFLRENGSQPRSIVHAGFVEAFGREDVSVANLKQQLLRMRLTTGRAPVVPVEWSDEEVEFVGSRRAMSRKALLADFHIRFDRPDIDLTKLQTLMTRKGWTTRSRRDAVVWSDEEIAFVEANQTLPRKELHLVLVARFGRPDLTEENVKSLASRRGFKTGRTGGFEKGSTPANKGKKCPEGVGGRSEAARKTQFKKGCRSGVAVDLYQPIGTEVVRDGYLWRKVNDDMPLQRRWKSVHSIEWEATNGPVPENHVLKCLDGNRLNTDQSNWEAIHRGVLSRLNEGRHRKTLAYDQAPAELKPLVMTSAKLKHVIGTRRRKAAA